VALALPVFTSRQDASVELMAEQIRELQTAATGTAETLRGLAEQLAKTVTALDAGEADLAQRLAALRDEIARCDSRADQTQAELVRLGEVATALQARAVEFDRKLAGILRWQRIVAAVATLALVVAGMAWLF
jgi:chromosome segregation ATPase